MLYEISNPSDKYTIKAEDPKIAKAAVIMLSDGCYGLKDENGESVMPLLQFYSERACNLYIQKEFGDLCEYIENHKLEIAECLESVMSVGFTERITYEEALRLIPEEKKENFRAIIHDKNRSSMNNIGKRAWYLAKSLRK